MVIMQQKIVPTIVSCLLSAVLGFGLGILFQRCFPPISLERYIIAHMPPPEYSLAAFREVNSEVEHLLGERFPGSTLACYVVPTTIGDYEIVFSTGQAQQPRLGFSNPLKEELKTLIETKLAKVLSDESKAAPLKRSTPDN